MNPKSTKTIFTLATSEFHLQSTIVPYQFCFNLTLVEKKKVRYTSTQKPITAVIVLTPAHTTAG